MPKKIVKTKVVKTPDAPVTPREPRGLARTLRQTHEELEQQIENLVESQHELEKSRDRYAEFYDTAPVCFVTLTKAGVIRDINLPGVTLLHQGRHRLQGWPLTAFVARLDRKKFLSYLARCRQNTGPARALSVELQLLRKPDEKPVFIELVSILGDRSAAAYQCVFRDITDIKEMQETHRWLAAIIRSSDDAIIGKDLEGNVISCNQGAAQLYGYSPEELIGQKITILIPPEFQDEEAIILKRIKNGEIIRHYEAIRRHKNGSLIDVSLTISPIRDAHGKIIGASKIARDISQRKRDEKNLQESVEREKKAREAAEAASRAKDDFLAALSHELRTPLNPVLLIASEAVQDAELSPAVRTAFDTIRKNIELEARLIDDLLDLTRITHGKLALAKSETDIHAVLPDAIAAIQNDIHQKRIFLRFDLAAANTKIFGDGVRLHQIFWNVLKNAVKFTPEGGNITVSSRNPVNDKIRIEISDTGIGLTPEDIGRVFGAFTQGAHRFGGLGLGLAISRALVELHGGSIQALSAGRGQGATFIIELPAVQNLPANAGANAPAGKPSTTRLRKISIPQLRILLVEDHEATRVALHQLLLRRKHKVTTASSLSEARAALKNNGEGFDVLISDIGLPDGNGCELMRELRSRPDFTGIALTGYGMEQDVSTSEAAGFAAHLTKPININTLDQALATTLRH